MTRTTPIFQPGQRPSDRGTRFKRSFAQSSYVTAAWTWFMVLAGKAAEPVLVTSVLYASVKLLPIVHFPPQLDAVVFVAQFIALDVGGLSLNKLADQAHKDGNVTGAKQAKRLSVALVSVMLAGVILAGVDQVVKLDEQTSTVIDTSLLIARAVMAVLYSRVIHALKEEDLFHNPLLNESVDAKELAALNEALTALTVQIKAGQAEQTSIVCELINTALNGAMAAHLLQIKAEQAEMLHDLLQHQEQYLGLLDRLQNETMANNKKRATQTLAELNVDVFIETVMMRIETILIQRGVVSRTLSETCQTEPCETTGVPQVSAFANMALSSGADVSQKKVHRGTGVSETGRGETTENEVDKIVWPLLDAGKTVRGIEAETGIKKATVGRSRLRWTATHGAASTFSNETVDPSRETPADEPCGEDVS